MTSGGRCPPPHWDCENRCDHLQVARINDDGTLTCPHCGGKVHLCYPTEDGCKPMITPN